LDVHPKHLRVANVRTPIAAAHALDERRPRGQFCDEQPGRHVNARLDGLRGDDDAVAITEKEPRVSLAINRAEARVNESDLLQRVERLLPAS